MKKIKILFIGMLMICTKTASAQVLWGEFDSRTEHKDNAGLQGDQGAKSGFYQASTPVNYPSIATGWWHLLDVRHSNPTNNYAMQFSGSFFDQELWFRKVNNNPSQPWSKVVLQNPDGGVNLNRGWFGYKSNIEGYSWTDAALTTNSIEIVNSNSSSNSSSPTLIFHQYGSGGPQFRLAADGSNILYLESAGANSARNTNPYGGGQNLYFKKLHIDGELSVEKNMGIGVKNPQNKLDVNGTIHSKEVKVDMTGWSDFVFKKEYNLPTLEDVEKHITEKGHLENIPSEEEVLKNGINLGEMNTKLLQKIEELTLYMIEMKKENQALKSAFEKQNKEIEFLKIKNSNQK